MKTLINPPRWLVDACARGVMHLLAVNRLHIGASDVPLVSKAWAHTLINEAALTESDRDRVAVAFHTVAAADGDATPRAVIRALPRIELPSTKFLPKPGDKAAEEQFMRELAERFGTTTTPQ